MTKHEKAIEALKRALDALVEVEPVVREHDPELAEAVRLDIKLLKQDIKELDE